MEQSAIRNVFKYEDKDIRSKQMTVLFAEFVNSKVRNCANLQETCKIMSEG